jgi:cell fate (sporulation/competence/biofilm development) regulator YmcA (YheA/YmcA/DUF963 family)
MGRPHEPQDPLMAEWLRLYGHLDTIKAKRAVYLENYKAEKAATEQRIKEIRDEMRGIVQTQAELYAVTDYTRTGEKKR